MASRTISADGEQTRATSATLASAKVSAARSRSASAMRSATAVLTDATANAPGGPRYASSPKYPSSSRKPSTHSWKSSSANACGWSGVHASSSSGARPPRASSSESSRSKLAADWKSLSLSSSQGSRFAAIVAEAPSPGGRASERPTRGCVEGKAEGRPTGARPSPRVVYCRAPGAAACGARLSHGLRRVLRSGPTVPSHGGVRGRAPRPRPKSRQSSFSRTRATGEGRV